MMIKTRYGDVDLNNPPVQAGYRGSTGDDVGAFYCPYVPLSMSSWCEPPNEDDLPEVEAPDFADEFDAVFSSNK